MYSLEISDTPQRAVHFRERISLVLMWLPLVTVGLFLLGAPSIWTTSLTVAFSQDRESFRNDPSWVLAAVALVSAVLCAWVGVLGIRKKWQYNRRLQRGFLGSIAAALATMLLGTWTMTQAMKRGETPEVSMVMFLTMCAMLYGVVCAAITPRDRIYVGYEEEGEERDEAAPPRPDDV